MVPVSELCRKPRSEGVSDVLPVLVGGVDAFWQESHGDGTWSSSERHTRAASSSWRCYFPRLVTMPADVLHGKDCKVILFLFLVDHQSLFVVRA